MTRRDTPWPTPCVYIRIHTERNCCIDCLASGHYRLSRTSNFVYIKNSSWRRIRSLGTYTELEGGYKGARKLDDDSTESKGDGAGSLNETYILFLRLHKSHDPGIRDPFIFFSISASRLALA